MVGLSSPRSSLQSCKQLYTLYIDDHIFSLNHVDRDKLSVPSTQVLMKTDVADVNHGSYRVDRIELIACSRKMKFII